VSRPRPNLVAAAASLIVSAFAISGCGYFVVAGASVFAGMDGGGGAGSVRRVDAGTSSAAEITSLPRASSEPVQLVRVRISDAEGRALSLRLEYALPSSGTAAPASAPGAAGGGPLAPAATTGPFLAARLRAVRDASGALVVPGPVTETGALATSPAGLAYTLEWDLAGALGAPARAGIALRLVLRDPGSGRESAAFNALDQKVGNEPPAIDGVTVTEGEGVLVVAYRIADSTSDSCKVDAFFRRDGGARAALTPLDAQDLAGVETSPEPRERAFLWDGSAEPLLAGSASLVTVELVPVDDGLLAGAAAASAPRLLLFDAPAEARIASAPARAHGGPASIAFDLLDADDPSALVAVRFEVLEGPPALSGATSGTASPVSGPLVAPYPASPSGARSVFAWDHSRDLGSGPARRVALTVEPEGAGARPARTPVFTAGNSAPVVTLAAPLPPGVSGEVAIAVDVADDGPDPVEVSLAFSTGGSVFLPATLSAPAAPLASGPPGTPARHTLRWRSERDLPLAAATPVTLRVSARDGLAGGDGAPVLASTAVTNASPTPLSITAVVPAAGRVAGGTPVTVLGAGFVPGGTTATIGGAPLAGLVVRSGGALAGTTPPAAAPGAADVVVTTSAGSARLAAGFRYQDAPVVSSAAPLEGPVAGGGALVILGANLDGPSLAVSLGGRAVADAVAVSAGRIEGTVPAAAAPGLADLEVATAQGAVSLAAALRYLAAPAVGALAPAAGPLGGALVEVPGAGFLSSATTVAFGGVAASDVVVLSDARLRARAPASAAPRTVEVTVSTPAGSATRLAAFEYLPAPSIASVSPRFGPSGGGAVIRVTGGGFPSGGAGGAVAVEIGGVSCTSIAALDASTLDATAPALAPSVYDIAIRTAGGTATRARGFQSVGALSVAAVTPASGPAQGGGEVLIQGGGFVDGATAVSFGARALEDAVVVDAGTLAGRVPAAAGLAPGSVDVRVTTPLASVLVASAYFYIEAPRLDAIEPAEGSALTATAVVVRGAGFAPGATVSVGGVPLDGLAVLSSATMTGRVAAGIGVGALDLLVATDAGAAVLPGAFRALVAPAPAEVAPAAGPLAGGFEVDIRGAGFLSATRTATLGGALMGSVRVLSDELIRALVPPTATAGFQRLAVETAGGRSEVGGLYEAVAAPTIASVSGGPGPTSGGTSITISGSGFRAGGTRVTLGGVPVVSASVQSAVTISAVTPPGFAGAAALTVSTIGGSATLTAAFTYEGSDGGDPDDVAIQAVVPGEGPAFGDTLVSIVGKGFQGGSTSATIGGRALRDLVVVGTTLLRGRTSPGPIGAQDVVVTTGAGSATAIQAYSFRAAVAFAAASTSVREGAAIVSADVMLLTGGGPIPETVTVDCLDATPSEVGAATSGADYAAFARRTIRFFPGSPGGAVVPALVGVVPDSDVEPEEVVRLALVSPSANVLVTPIATHEVRIFDDDAEIVSFTAGAERAFIGGDLDLAWTLTGSGGPSLLLDPFGLDVGGLLSTALPPFEDPPALGAPPLALTLRTGEGVSRDGALRLSRAVLVALGTVTADRLGRAIAFAAAPAEDGSVLIAGTITLDSALAGTGTVVFDPLGPAPTSALISSTQPDAFVLRVSPEGRVAWVRRFGAAGVDDFARGAAAMPDGDAVFTGEFSQTITLGPGEPNATTLTAGTSRCGFVARFASDGTLRWARAIGRPGSSTGNASNALVGFPDGSVVAASNIDTAQPTTFGADEAFATTFPADASRNIALTRFGRDGTLLWAKEVRGAGSKTPNVLAAASDGGFYVGGTISGFNVGAGVVNVRFGEGEPGATTLSATSGTEGFFARYRADGTLAWASLVAGTTTASESVTGIAALADGGAVATVVNLGAGSRFIGAVALTPTANGGASAVRVDADGAPVWTRGTWAGASQASPLADGSVAVFGSLSSSATVGVGEPGERTLAHSGATGNDGAYARFAPDDGRLLDAAVVAAASSATFASGASQSVQSLAPRRDGGVDAVVVSTLVDTLRVAFDGAAAATFTSTENRNRIVLASALNPLSRSVSVSPRGLAWLAGSEGSGDAQARGVAAAPDGGAFVGGSFSGEVILGPGEAGARTLSSPVFEAGFVARLRPDGALAWVVTASASDGDVRVDAVGALPGGGAVVAGRFGSAGGGALGAAALGASSGGWDVFVARLDAGGDVLWLRTGGGDDDDEVAGVVGLPDGGLYVLARTESGAISIAGASPTGPGMLLARYRGDGSGVFGVVHGDDEVFPSGIAMTVSGNAVVVGSYTDSGDDGIFFHTGAGSIEPVGAGPFAFERGFLGRFRHDTGLCEAVRAVESDDMCEPRAVAGLADGGVVVAGEYYGILDLGGLPAVEAIDPADVFVARFGLDLGERWLVTVSGTGDDRACGIGVLPDGDVLVGGTIRGETTFGPGESRETPLAVSGAADVFLARFRGSDGALRSARRAASAGGDEARALSIGPDGSAALAGQHPGALSAGIGEPNERALPAAPGGTGARSFVFRTYDDGGAP
jgi:hypothetical protein